MKIKNHDCVTLEQIEEFEKGTGLEFPEEYKQFLLKCNGGTVAGEMVPIITIPNTVEQIGLNKFYGIVDTEEDDIRFINNKYKDEMDGKTLIIGEDFSENFIVLLFQDESTYVGYWDQKIKMEISSEDANAYLLTETFAEFIEAFGALEFVDSNTFETEIKYVSLGSVVRLVGDYEKFMVTGRGVFVNRNEEEVFFDYVGVPFPEGLTGTEVIYFNRDTISEVVFEGYSDSENTEYVDKLSDFVMTHPDLKMGTY